MSFPFFSPKDLQGAVVTVMGLGRHKKGSGVGAVKWLMRHGAQVVITDLKSEDELKESVAEVMLWYDEYRRAYPDREISKPIFTLGEHKEDDFQNAQLVVQNPGVPRESKFVQLARRQGITVESDVSLFLRFCPFPVYAITGTRGKSTTTAWLGEMLKTLHPKTVIAGNILHSPLEDLDWLLEESAPVPIVLELSSWLLESLENVEKPAEIAILTNVYKDHLDRYESFTHYKQAKELIFHHQTKKQVAILNADQEITKEIATRLSARTLWFSLSHLQGKEGAWVEEEKIVCELQGERKEICAVSELLLLGEHNVANALAAILGAMVAGVSLESIRQTLKTFTGLPGRQQKVFEKDGVVYVNDTSATSPEGVIAALKRFDDHPIILLAGGNTKGFTYEEMGEWIQKTCKQVILFDGTGTQMIEDAMKGVVPVKRVSSMKEAVMFASESAQSGDIVLLSPGGSSFALFKNEFDRGDQFNIAVAGLSFLSTSKKTAVIQ
ncbi:TPA: UDP-N-acetylmuramoyl-L-alanine--D-glutamate ligase [Candidatus Uhrbacteria bacterium]|uniref:UDP-N-acetylmuramoylalanine--D-glutamate ligase n=2 Tax=Candidatus Uhriibacteriota TaxID=1752732 RepID=A0A0G1Q9W2_9BACT|nr:MAG: UDP-N-acetylmuramoylalanine-D-glutamate ligase [Candidatus Uhrbacteria bacterium GW2011_GWF2_46_218]KKU41846.1 MAG: UDP-N-acetylmuramoylalanine-D-glutamate ligase [Candidatus Uhrbacteria bacterium GW2011_GWE2_46_68]HBK34105.1 UDP-N-acetylmuramoyl-L-alanine--D-glutamate ligase [Candidatus Uhrbacteria bacterium]HCB18918.1 UDP-N-acetylmuramoyl-L-alanine--D-glutamate ligase [Candidatus Uhrbacteria bacterium]